MMETIEQTRERLRKLKQGDIINADRPCKATGECKP